MNEYKIMKTSFAMPVEKMYFYQNILIYIIDIFILSKKKGTQNLKKKINKFLQMELLYTSQSMISHQNRKKEIILLMKYIRFSCLFSNVASSCSICLLINIDVEEIFHTFIPQLD